MVLEDGELIVNPKHYEFEKYLEENINKDYKKVLKTTKKDVIFGERQVFALGIVARVEKSGVLIDNVSFLQWIIDFVNAVKIKVHS